MYCKKCGYKLNPTDSYCPNCGEKVCIEVTNSKDKMFNALAYLGFSFFVPLLENPNEINKRHANNGLWILILCAPLSIFNSLLSNFRGAFNDSAWIYDIMVSPIHIAYFIFMLFIGYKVLKNVVNIYTDKEIEKILFFDKARIIK